MSEDPTEEEVKEVYARFGLAYYFSEVLHRGLCNYYALAPFELGDDVNKLRIEERLDLAWSTTLGQIVRHVADTELPQDLVKRLDDAVERRNALAHDFWFENSHKLFSRSGVEELLEELDEAVEIFRTLDEEVEEYSRVKVDSLDVDEQVFQEALENILSGEEPEPLHDQRTLNKQERVVSAYGAPVSGGDLLVFETEDGELWQLSDVGLAWAPFDEVGSEWTQVESLSPYLPATIDPRPEKKAPFHYSIELANGGALQIEKRGEEKVWRVVEK